MSRIPNHEQPPGQIVSRAKCSPSSSSQLKATGQIKEAKCSSHMAFLPFNSSELWHSRCRSFDIPGG